MRGANETLLQIPVDNKTVTFPWPQPPDAPTSAWHSQQVSSRVLRTTLLTSSSVILRAGPDPWAHHSNHTYAAPAKRLASLSSP